MSVDQSQALRRLLAEAAQLTEALTYVLLSSGVLAIRRRYRRKAEVSKEVEKLCARVDGEGTFVDAFPPARTSWKPGPGLTRWHLLLQGMADAELQAALQTQLSTVEKNRRSISELLQHVDPLFEPTAGKRLAVDFPRSWNTAPVIEQSYVQLLMMTSGVLLIQIEQSALKVNTAKWYEFVSQGIVHIPLSHMWQGARAELLCAMHRELYGRGVMDDRMKSLLVEMEDFLRKNLGVDWQPDEDLPSEFEERGPHTTEQWADIIGISVRVFQRRHGPIYKRSLRDSNGQIYLRIRDLPPEAQEKVEVELGRYEGIPAEVRHARRR